MKKLKKIMETMKEFGETTKNICQEIFFQYRRTILGGGIILVLYVCFMLFQDYVVNPSTERRERQRWSEELAQAPTKTVLENSANFFSWMATVTFTDGSKVKVSRSLTPSIWKLSEGDKIAVYISPRNREKIAFSGAYEPR